VLKPPLQFQCMGMTVEVEVDVEHDKDVAGHFYPEDAKITIAPTDNEEYRMVTFFHEYMHCVFGTLGYEKDNKNERKIDQIAQCLYQLMKTSVTEDDVKPKSKKR